jgi:diacylglycerol kinase family enzyme
MGRALVYLSPAARGGGHGAKHDRLVAAIEAALKQRGLTADVRSADSAEEAAALLKEAPASGYDLAVVAGGDGTVRLAVHSLAGTSLPLAIVPLGTGNLLAATLGIPRDPFAAAERLATAEPVTIDTGVLVADEARETFAVAAGAGFDARVMSATSPNLKSRFGVLAYFATVLRMLPSLPSSDTEIVVDGRTFHLQTVAVLVANSGQLVPGLVGPRSPLDPTDGLLDVVAIRSGNFPGGLRTTASSAIDSLLRAEPGIGGASLRQRGRVISVKTEPAEPIQVDGDILPLTGGAFTATIKPRSLTVLV